ncbi:MAG: hypothetical protein RR941_01025, partial [Erysipelotrichaceae bacterium]
MKLEEEAKKHNIEANIEAV